MFPPSDRADRAAHQAVNALTAARARAQLMRRRWGRDDVDCARDLEELAAVEAEIDRAVDLLRAGPNGAVVVVGPDGAALAGARSI